MRNAGGITGHRHDHRSAAPRDGDSVVCPELPATVAGPTPSAPVACVCMYRRIRVVKDLLPLDLEGT